MLFARKQQLKAISSPGLDSHAIFTFCLPRGPLIYGTVEKGFESFSPRTEVGSRSPDHMPTASIFGPGLPLGTPERPYRFMHFP